MKRYQATLQRHLGDYAKRRLGVLDKGTYKRRQYSHVLPYRQRYLNFLESVRAELQDYLHINPSIKLHAYFHHLNSSQAFALNLFYPYFAAGGNAARALSAALGVDSNVADWEFEGVPDKKEGTNVDVMWRTPAGASVFCEVKLSEAGFGPAKNDDRHQSKLAKIYRPRLKALVSENLLQERVFFKNYQLLRNISLLSDNPRYQLVILAPRENESLHPPLQKVLASVDPSVRERIVVAYVEDCLTNLKENPSLSPDLRAYAERMQEKYVLPQASG
jgi:hypothetical protein